MSARTPYEACPLCDGTSLEESHVASCTGHPNYRPELPELMRWLRCMSCDHEFVDGYFTDEGLRLVFSGTMPNQEPGYDVEGSRYVSAKIVESLGAVRDGGRWLDVGFGNGSLLTTAAEFGWRVAGVDLREASVLGLRDLGVEAHLTDFTAYEPPEPLDVISMADVLEHMPFPTAALEHARNILRADGRLFLSMPNSDSFLWKTLTKNGVNPYFGELEHLHNFGRARLYRLLEENGFTPERYTVSVRYRACMEVIARVAPTFHGDLTRVPAVADTSHPPKREGDLRLNLGCGRSPIPGWVNVDSFALPGVDVVADLEAGVLPFDDDSVVEFAASHLIEHIAAPLKLMQELHRVAKPGAIATFRCPYGSSDDADTDPTHVRRYFWGSWGFFSQPYYWRADYGYRGDWEVEDIVLTVLPELVGKSWDVSFRAVNERRNVVTEMVTRLRAVKPIRAPLRELQKQPLVKFVASQ